MKNLYITSFLIKNQDSTFYHFYEVLFIPSCEQKKKLYQALLIFPTIQPHKEASGVPSFFSYLYDYSYYWVLCEGRI